MDLALYGAIVRARVANRAVADPLTRVCRNGSTKVPNHLLSSIREARGAGRPHALLTLAVAGWCRYLRGVDEEGEPVELDDPQAARLQELAHAGGPDPRPLLADSTTFGTLGACPRFAAAVERDLRDLDAFGARAVLAVRAGRAVAAAS
jgi:fructuronate reductase/mannitol 2-dehydrogenase